MLSLNARARTHQRQFAADKDLTVGDGSSRELDSDTEFIPSVGGLVAVVKSRHTPAGPLDEYEQAVAASIETFGSATQAVGEHGKRERTGRQSRGGATTIFRRLPEPRGPLTVFGYDYFASHAKAAGIPTPRLLSYQGEWGGAEEYAYEALNFADGTRTAQQIDAELSAEYGPIPTDLVVEYMEALRKIGVVQ